MTSSSTKKCATCDFFVGAGKTLDSNKVSVRHEMNGYGSCQVSGKDVKKQVNGVCAKFIKWRMLK